MDQSHHRSDSRKLDADNGESAPPATASQPRVPIEDWIIDRPHEYNRRHGPWPKWHPPSDEPVARSDRESK